ncbi:MAG: carbon-nitrogen hydrolase family protein [Rhizobiaceae bacterium]|jgi:predicted amidohydrolase|nr:carbon-nitrogen hydrolase family protein [Rhizobiaceae bacterium]
MMRVAAIQMRSGLQPGDNLVTLRRLVREAAATGARYVQTPEMTGAIQRDRAALLACLRKPEDDLVVAEASRLAAELSVTLHIGSTPVLSQSGKVANRAFVFGPQGGLIATYDKLHLFDVDLANGESWRESSTYGAGDRAVLAQAAGTQIGLGICYDLRFPELFALYAMNGATVLTVPAAFTRQTGEAHWHVLLRARAIETGSFVIAAAQGGVHADGRETYGHSLIIDPWGRILAEKPDAEPGVISADLNLADVEQARQRIPNLRHRRAIHVAAVTGDDVADYRI